MATSIEMPELGESVTEDTITTWLKKVGGTTEVSEPLLKVSTGKVDTEIPSSAAGVLIEILLEEDDTVSIGEVITKVGESGEGPENADDSARETEEGTPKEEAEGPKKGAPKTASGSTTDVEMPKPGESVTEGTITTWLRKVGDTVEVNEPLLKVSTDEVDTGVPSPVVGTLLEILYDEDDTVDVGKVIARVDDANAAPAAEEPTEEEAEEAPAVVGKDEEPVKTNEETEEGSTTIDAGDAIDVEMPGLGESVTEGTVTTWLKKVGGIIKADESLLEVSADKVDTEIPSPIASTLLEVLYNEDDIVDVGEIIARVGSGQPKKDTPKKGAPKKEEPKKKAPKAEAPEAESKPPANRDIPYVTPLVRKLADKHGVDLTKVEGSGVGGCIRKQDVSRAAEGGRETVAEFGSNWSAKDIRPKLAELRDTTQRVNRTREITVAKALESLQASTQLTQVHEADVTAIWDLRATKKAEFEKKHDAKLTFLPFFAKVTVEALISHPNVNASQNEGTKEITYHEQVNLGTAVDTERGLLPPVIHNAQSMSLPELAAAIADIADRARNNKLTPSGLSGGTFTITNIGSESALTGTPILVPPRAVMTDTGAIKKRVVVVTENEADAIGIRAMVLLPITYDHRLIDGAGADRLMTTVVDHLEVANSESDLQL